MLFRQDIHPGAKGIKVYCEWWLFFIFFKWTQIFILLNFVSEMGISLGSHHRILTQDLYVCKLLQILFLVCQPTSKCLTISLYEQIAFSPKPHIICTDMCIYSTYEKCERFFFLNMWVCIIWVCIFIAVHVEARLHGSLYGFLDAVVNVGNNTKQCFLILIGSWINSEWSVSGEDMGKSSGTT